MIKDFSCAFATSLDSPEHTRIAEKLGYKRAWFYDSPALYPDVWVQLVRAAEQTEHIGLGPGVLIPHLRHPMVTASAIATLVDAASQNRVAVGVGTGFTGCVSMGQRPLTWRYVSKYVDSVKRLLNGDEVEWDGGLMKMMHWPGFAPSRPINVPFLYAAGGPKGLEVAQQEANGVILPMDGASDFDWCVCLTLGTVLENDESADSPRALDAAGHGTAVIFHLAMEHGVADILEDNSDWVRSYESIPPAKRHITMHDGHLVGINEHDQPFIDGKLIAANGLALDSGAWKERIAELSEKGVTEIAYQPAGSNIPRELEAFSSLF
jgi:5,10-methylenetetrahydromethanopterin reductase